MAASLLPGSQRAVARVGLVRQAKRARVLHGAHVLGHAELHEMPPLWPTHHAGLTVRKGSAYREEAPKIPATVYRNYDATEFSRLRRSRRVAGRIHGNAS